MRPNARATGSLRILYHNQRQATMRIGAIKKTNRTLTGASGYFMGVLMIHRVQTRQYLLNGNSEYYKAYLAYK